MIRIAGGLRAALFICCCLAADASGGAPGPADFAAALSRVEAGLAERPGDLQLIFTKGMLLAELGRPLDAADIFRRMLAVDPALLRPRLELARVLAQAGDYEAARYHFEQVLAHPLPDAVRRNVLTFLARIREELPTYSVTVELASDTNPNQATSKEEVVIDGVNYRLNADARARDSVGWRVALGGRIPLPAASLWFVRGQAQHEEHDGTQLDFSYLQTTAGRHFKFPLHTLTVEGGHHWARYQHAELYAGAVASLSDFRLLRPDLSLELSLSALELRYPLFSFRDGWQTVVGAKIVYAHRPDSRWELAADYVVMDAKEAAYSFAQSGASARYVREWSGGWISGGAVRLSRARYEADDPFFGKRRDEVERRLELDLTNRRIRIWRLSPRLTFGYVEHASNVDFFAWSRTYIRLGMTGDF